MAKGAPVNVVVAMRAALDEVTDQVRAMAVKEVIGVEDLEWSFDGPDGWGLFVQGARSEVVDESVLVAVTVHARKRFRHAEESRNVKVDLSSP